MNILRVITRLNIGGPARQACFLQHAFNNTEHTSHLIYGKLDQDEGDFSHLLQSQGNVLFLDKLTRPIQPINDILTIIYLLRWLNKNPIDIIHTHTAKAGLVGRTAAWAHNTFFSKSKLKKKIKIIHTYHGHVFSGYFSSSKTKLIKSAERFLWKRSDAIITLNEKLSSEIQSHLSMSKDKINIIPLGLDLKKYLGLKRSPYFSEIFKQDDDCFWIGWVGRLTSIKNPLRFLDICKKMTQHSNLKLRFVLVGDGNLRKETENQIKTMKLENSVFILGWAEDLYKAYSGLDLFINTSDNEGTPVAALEALSAGIPLALSNVGGTKEAVPEHACISLFEPENYDHLISHWCNIIQAKCRIDQHVSKNIVDHFSEKRLFGQLQSLYLKLMSN